MCCVEWTAVSGNEVKPFAMQGTERPVAFVQNLTQSSFAQFPGAGSNLYALMPGYSLWQEPLWAFVCQGVKSKFSVQNNSQFLVSVAGEHWMC